jgi:PKD domain-containing protein
MGSDPEKSMIRCVVRSGASLLVFVIGLVGLYGSSAPRCSGSEGDSEMCVRDPPSGGGGGSSSTPTTPAAPAPVIPDPVVAINDRGVGYVAYAESGNITVRRFNGAAGFEGASVVASGFEQDMAVAIAGGQARVAWRGENGRVSVLTGDESGAWQPQIDVATGGADDPVIASDQHAATLNTFVAWRRGTTQSNGFPATNGVGSATLIGEPALLTRYAADEDVAVNSLFELRVATSGTHVAAAWIAAQRSDSSISHIYVARVMNAVWGEAVRLAPVIGGQSTAIGMDADGNALLIWPQTEGIFYSRYSVVSDSWSAPAAVRTEVSPLGQVQIDVAPNGRAIAAWSMIGGGVWAAEYDVTSGRWLDIHQLDLTAATDPLQGQDPRVAIDGVGRAIVVWRGGGRAYANEHERSSGWTNPELLGSTASALDLDVDDDGLGVAVWWQDGLQSRIWNRAGAPSPVFTVDPDPGVAGQSLLFDGQASAGPFPITQYLWHWGDDTPDTIGSSVETHAFQTPGNYTARLQITDSAAQTATTSRPVHVAPLGELLSMVTVSYSGPGDGSLEIHSAQPGFTTVQCATHTGAGQPTDTGTCSATVQAGYEITIVAVYDPVRTIFSGWTEGRHACTTLASSTAPGGTRAECRFSATSADRAFNVTFAIAPPATDILRIQLNEMSRGNGHITSSPSLIDCSVEGPQILNSTGGICNYSIAHGGTITVFGQPAIDGSTFIDWQGCDSQPATNQCTVTMSGFRTIFARFGQ